MNAMNRLLLIAIPGLLMTSGTSAFAQPWTLTSAPITNWQSAAASADGQRLVAAGYDGVYFSTNAGVTWDLATVTLTNGSAIASSADGRSLLAATWGFGVYISTNYGATWSDSGAPHYPWAVAASSAGGQTLAVAGGTSTGSMILVSTNGGTTWTNANYSEVGSSIWLSAAISADGETVVVVGYVGGHFGGGNWAASTNGSMSWVGVYDDRRYWRSIACSADGTKWVAGAWVGLYRSSDFGVTWAPTGTPISNWWSSVASSADGSRLAAVGGGLISVSTNSGANWKLADAPYTNWSSIVSSADGCRLVGAVNGGGIYTWQSTPTPVLNITPSDSGLLLSWIVPSMPFVLQENSDLTTANWSDVTTAPILNFTNLHHEVRIPLSGSNKFYRLKRL